MKFDFVWEILSRLKFSRTIAQNQLWNRKRNSKDKWTIAGIKNDPENERSKAPKKKLKMRIEGMHIYIILACLTVEWKIKRRETQTKRETHMKGEFDACLVIQVAENDFTSSNLRLCTRLSSYVATLLPHSERNVGYIKSSLWWNSDAKGKTISFGETKTWAESGLEFTGRQFLWPGLAAELLMSRTNFNI